MRKTFTPVVLTAFALACGAYFFWVSEPSSSVAVPVTGNQKISSSEFEHGLQAPIIPAIHASAPSTVRLGGANSSPLNPLLEKLTLLRGARSFVLESVASKDAKAIPYAWRVLEDCRRFVDLSYSDGIYQPNMVLVPPQDQAAASAAFSRLQVRCELFTPDEVGLIGGLEKAFAQSRAATVAAVIGDLLAQGTDIARRKALQIAIDSGDPLLWDTFGTRILLQRDERGSYLGIAGSKYYVSAQPDVLAALELVPCVLGFPCGADATDILIDCAMGHGCYQSRHEKIQKRSADADMKQFFDLLIVTNLVATAIKGLDSKAFAP